MLTRPIRQDLLVWKDFLTQYNGRSIINKQIWCQTNVIHLYSDASGRGYAAVMGNQWFNGAFPADWLKLNIAIKEFVPVFLALKCWLPLLRDHTVLFHIDNMSVVFNILNQTSYLQEIMFMLRKMVLLAMSNNVFYSATHIKGKLNVVADRLSRFQIERARELAPYLDELPRQIPDDWLPWKQRQFP